MFAEPSSEQLAQLRQAGVRCGVTRVTDITRLDRIGMPVFAAIRPQGVPGSLCVHAGKGATSLDAEIGAWMEAIEYACSEPDASPVTAQSVLPQDILDGNLRPDAILDFCPRMGAAIERDVPLAAVFAEDVFSSKTFAIPAECVFVPFDAADSPSYFGYSTTGIGAGFTRLDAMVHGLNEVIERDILSFHALRESALLRVFQNGEPDDSLPESCRKLCADIHAAGLRLLVRYLDNTYELPCFQVLLDDPEELSLLLLNGGSCCHPHREVALLGAIREAVQSRLSVIHGGRDDLETRAARLQDRSPEEQLQHKNQTLDRWRTASQVVSFNALSEAANPATDTVELWEILAAKVREQGLRHIFVVSFTEPSAAIPVVKVVVPGMEEFELNEPRMGRRLAAWVQA